MPRVQTSSVLLPTFFVLTTACASVPYDLAEVPFPVMASPGKDADGEAFEVRGHHTMWVHGRLGESKPDVAAELTKACTRARASATSASRSVPASTSGWSRT